MSHTDLLHENAVAKRVRFNAQLMAEDMELRGWSRNELAKRAGVADNTVYRFLRGEFQTGATARKLARALRRNVRRYLISNVNQAVA